MGVLDYYKQLAKESELIDNKIKEYTNIEDNKIVDPRELMDYRFKKQINNGKFDFLLNIFLTQLKTSDDIVKLIDNATDEKIKNSYKKGLKLKEISAFDSVFTDFSNKLEEDIEKDPSTPNPFKGLQIKEQKGKFREILNSNEKLQKQLKDATFYHFYGMIVSGIKANPKEFDALFLPTINDNIEKEFDKQLKENPPLEVIDETRKLTNEEDVKEFENLAKTDEDKEALEYVQNEILTVLNSDATMYYSQNAEEYGKKSEQNLREITIESANKDKRFNNIIVRERGSQTNQEISFENSGHDPIKVKEDYMTLKPIFTDKTKDIMKKILTKLDNMERFNIPPKENEPLFSLDYYQPEEGNPKVYGFIGLKDLNSKAIELIENKTPENLKELKRLAEFHKNMVKDYDELIDLAKEFNSSSICGNIGSSRVSSLPTKYIKDFENVSKINEMWHCLALIKRTNCTIDEFVENPTGIYRQAISNLKDYKFIDDIGKNKDPLEFMDAIKKSSQEVRDAQNDLLKKSDVLRSVSSIGHFEKDNMSHNALVGGLNHGLIEGESFEAIFSSTQNYFEKNTEVQTLKNLIVCQDETISKVELTANPNYNKDIFTGKTVNNFDYDKYLDERDIDIEKLANNLTALKTKVENERAYLGYKDVFKKAARDITNDLLLKKDIKHHPSYAEFLEASSISCQSIVKSDKNIKPHKYSRNVLNDFKNEPNKGKEISRLLIAYKGLNDLYNKRSRFSKIFNLNAWRERSAKNDIRQELIDQNIEKRY